MVYAVVSLPILYQQGASLSAAAAASGRPPECTSRSRRALSKGPSIWERTRVPNLQKYCDLMARAQTQLQAMPDAAGKAAEEADRALPGRAAPVVIRARAALAAGALDDAAKAFAAARRIDPRSVEDPSTMRDLARVLARTGKRDEALVVYRSLVPRVDLLSTADQRILVLLEAAHLSMALEGASGALPKTSELAKPKGPPRPRLDEALAYLREARQRRPSRLASDVLLSLALAQDRAGARDDVDATLLEARAEASKAGARVRAESLDDVAVPEDRVALEALAAEGTDRAAAQKAWETFLAGPGGKGPWAAAAKARLDALKKGGPPPGKGKKPR